MKPRVYVETSVISYLTARPSRRPIVAGHQAITREWWDSAPLLYDCYISEFVLEEASAGDAAFAKARVEALKKLKLLETTKLSKALAGAFLASGTLPAKAAIDAAHLAIAAVHQIDFLVTWNCRHLANAALWAKFKAVCDRLGLATPVICTPAEL